MLLLQWHHHVSAVAKKGNTTLHMISRNLRYCPRNTRSLAYSTLVRPKLEYCASVWDPHQQRDIDALERINRRAARVTYNKLWRERDVSVSALLADLKWEPLRERRRQKRLSLMYRVTHELVAVPPTRLEKPARTTRGHSFKYRTIGATCEPVKNSFYPRTIIDWNALRPDVVASPSLDSFKHCLAMP